MGWVPSLTLPITWEEKDGGSKQQRAEGWGIAVAMMCLRGKEAGDQKRLAHRVGKWVWMKPRRQEVPEVCAAQAGPVPNGRPRRYRKRWAFHVWPTPKAEGGTRGGAWPDGAPKPPSSATTKQHRNRNTNRHPFPDICQPRLTQQTIGGGGGKPDLPNGTRDRVDATQQTPPPLHGRQPLRQRGCLSLLPLATLALAAALHGARRGGRRLRACRDTSDPTLWPLTNHSGRNVRVWGHLSAPESRCKPPPKYEQSPPPKGLVLLPKHKAPLVWSQTMVSLGNFRAVKHFFMRKCSDYNQTIVKKKPCKTRFCRNA